MLPSDAHHHTHTALRRAAALLLPADGTDAELSIGADDLTSPAHSAVRLCALPPASEPGLMHAIGSAVRRTMSLARARVAPPAGYHLTGVHDLTPTELGVGPRAILARHLKAGAIIELHRTDGVRRVIDEVLDETGADAHLRFTSGGGILTHFGSGHILRVSILNTPAVDALRALHGHRHVPQLVAWGNTAGASWTLETRLDGRRPRHIDDNLAADILGFCVSLPEQASAPIAPFDDLDDLRAFFPERKDIWLNAKRRLAHTVPSRCIARHGDLWIGNLLATRGRLTGVVDWDSWHVSAMPGADLLHVFAFDAADTFGASVRAQPWRDARVRARCEPYWRGLSIVPTDDIYDAAGISWWVGHLAATVRRDPDLATEQRWILDNIDSVGELL